MCPVCGKNHRSTKVAFRCLRRARKASGRFLITQAREDLGGNRAAVAAREMAIGTEGFYREHFSEAERMMRTRER